MYGCEFDSCLKDYFIGTKLQGLLVSDSVLELNVNIHDSVLELNVNIHGFVLIPVLSTVCNPGVRWVGRGAEGVILRVLLIIRYITETQNVHTYVMIRYTTIIVDSNTTIISSTSVSTIISTRYTCTSITIHLGLC